MGFFDKIMDDVLGDPFGSYHQAAEAQGAAQRQAGAAQQGIEEQRTQWEEAQKILRPFVQAGERYIGQGSFLDQLISGSLPALQQQRALSGLGAPGEEQQVISEIEQSPEFQTMMGQAEEALLQNASATGGLRGGNLQRALMEVRPQILNSLINQRYSRLGGLTGLGVQTGTNLASMGQASAAGQAAQGIETGQAIAGLLGQKGAAEAMGTMAAASGRGSGLRDALDVGKTVAQIYGAF